MKETYKVGDIHDAILDGLGAVDGELELHLLLLAALVLWHDGMRLSLCFLYRKMILMSTALSWVPWVRTTAIL